MAKKKLKAESVLLETKEEKVVLELKSDVKFEFKNCPFIKNGDVLNVTEEMAQRFIKKGYGKVCND